MGTIPIKIRAHINAEHVTADGHLRPNEKGMVEILLPEAVCRAAHVLPASAGLRSRLLQPALVPVDADGVYTDPQTGKYSIPVVEVPYAGWWVDPNHDEHGTAAVIDHHNDAVATFHRSHPATGASPAEQARSWLNDLRGRT